MNSYEAWVLWCFYEVIMLCLDIRAAEAFEKLPGKMSVEKKNRIIKWSILQFPLLTPVFDIVAIILFVYGKFDIGKW
jgi:hypothetical protein